MQDKLIEGRCKMRKATALKVILLSVIGIALLWLTKEIFFPTNYNSIGINISGNYGGEHMNINYGSGSGILSVLLIFIIKFFVVMLIVTFLVGLFMLAKNYLFNEQEIATIKGSFSSYHKAKKVCSNCGKPLVSEWKVCPNCATEINNNNENITEVIYE